MGRIHLLECRIDSFSNACGELKQSISYVVVDYHWIADSPNKVLWPCHIQTRGNLPAPYENWNMNSIQRSLLAFASSLLQVWMP
mmetsp:Transcript_10565/g.16014  ORF Transcript_10565/g.16014 Transcript_10565/m.16014 type:complete len:84 (+) Transcript_10565:191-442(+)